MKELKTKSKEFDCDFCTPFNPKKQLFLRVSGSSIAEVASVFSNSEELETLSYGGKPLSGYSRLNTIRDEGSQIFVVLE